MKKVRTAILAGITAMALSFSGCWREKSYSSGMGMSFCYAGLLVHLFGWTKG